MKAPSAEFQLLVECCRAGFASGERPKIGEMCRTIDWRRFVRHARFHRVQGLVWHCFCLAQVEVPPEHALALSTESESIVTANLRMAVESRDLHSDFAKAGLDLLFVKGLTIGSLAYRRPQLKMGWDIDLLIGPKQLAQSADLLRSRGYRMVTPPGTANLARWHIRNKESVWTREAGLHVELHTRLADNRLMIPSIDVHSQRQLVEVSSGITLPTLAGDPLFAYLCVHGAASAWFRLKWIADLAGLLARYPPAEIERLYDVSQSLGAGRAADQALLLADALFGSLADTNLEARLKRHGVSRWLAATAYRQLVGNLDCREPTETPLGTARIHLTQLPLMPGPRFALSELARQIGDFAKL
ncbi:MAG: nucleotidyltransferase family protein [Sphingomicrobium sp.]